MADLHTCTVAELKATLTAAEVVALPKAVVAAGAESEEAWLQDKLLRACDRVVAAVGACERNPRIKPGVFKVPGGLVHTTLVLARHAVIASLPGMSETLEGSSRAAEYSTAVQDLARVASCELFVADYAGSEDPDVEGGEGGMLLLHGEKPFNWVGIW